MQNKLTAQDIINDIEFELAQGAISKDDLGQGIKRIKQYQNQLRNEVFQPGQEMPQLRELVGRQFQINDMLIILVQETAAALQDMQQTNKRLANWQPLYSTDRTIPESTAVSALYEPIWHDEDEIHSAMADRLNVKLEMQPSNVPLLRSWLQRFKHEAHSLVLFYLRKLADRQTIINHTYGSWLLRFHTLHQQQQQEIHQLQAQLTSLQARLDSKNNSPEQS
jgi:hypothetical protein